MEPTTQTKRKIGPEMNPTGEKRNRAPMCSHVLARGGSGKTHQRCVNGNDRQKWKVATFLLRQVMLTNGHAKMT